MEFAMIKPIGHGTDIMMVVMSVFLIGLCAFLLVMFISAQSYKLTVAEKSLHIRSVFYNTDIPLSDIRIQDIHIADYKSLNITARTNGMGLPGLLVGWFRGNGKKYKMYVTDKNNVLCIPTNKNYDILFSTTDSDSIIQLIQNESR